MTSIQPRFTNGPRTYNAGEVIDGGQLVEARAGSVIGVAGDASAKVLGVAQKKAAPGPAVGVSRVADASGHLDLTLAPTEVAVISDGFVPVTYAAAAAFGDRLVAAAGGKVRPFAATDPDGAGALTADAPHTIVGWCAELNGVALNGVGLTRINL